MPAIVRGGRRQAPLTSPAKPRSATTKSPAGRATVSKSQNAKSSTSRGRGTAASSPMGKSALVGRVAVPNELLGWLMAVLLLVLTFGVLASHNHSQGAVSTVTRFLDQRLASLGFVVNDLELKGQSKTSQDDIWQALNSAGVHKGMPLALLDINAVKDNVEKVGWVKSATVRRLLPDRLIIDVVENPRLAVWQNQKKSYVIDDKGHIIPEAKVYNFNNLPLVVGEGANEQAAEIVELLHDHPQLMSRIEALVRVDTRRWDIRFNTGTRALLPAIGEDTALNRLENLQVQKRILDQGFDSIDLRLPDALFITPSTAQPKAPQKVTG